MSSKCDQASDLWQQLELESDLQDFATGRVYFSKRKHSGIGSFVKKCPFPEKLFFLNLIRGI